MEERKTGVPTGSENISEEAGRVMAYLEEGIGDPRVAMERMQRCRTLLHGVISFELENGLTITKAANFVDGMKYALGMMTVDQVRDPEVQKLLLLHQALERKDK